MIPIQNLYAPLPDASASEHVATLLQTAQWRLERIVSLGQQTPPGQWYDQATAEWVMLLTGEAQLQIEGETGRRTLRPGDYLLLPAHVRHRVEWTHPTQPSIWLALHYTSGETLT